MSAGQFLLVFLNLLDHHGEMGLHHAEPGEVVDLATWGSEIPPGKAKTIFKSEPLEIVRLSLPAGREIAEHKAPGLIVVHCLEGAVEFVVDGEPRPLAKGQLLYLEGNEPHSLTANEDSVILLTICRVSRSIE